MKEINETGELQIYKPGNDRLWLAWWMAKHYLRLPLRWVIRSCRRGS